MSELDLTRPLQFKGNKNPAYTHVYIGKDPDTTLLVIKSNTSKMYRAVERNALENVPETVHCVVAVFHDQDRILDRRTFCSVQSMEQFQRDYRNSHKKLLSFVELDIDI